MARSEARIFTRIWTDDQFYRRSVLAQWLYLFLLSQPALSLCGVIDYHPSRWSRFLPGSDGEAIDLAASELEDHDFVVIDRDTDELWVRTLLKNDVWRGSTRVHTGATRAWSTIVSERIRRAVVYAVQECVKDSEREADPSTWDKSFFDAYRKAFPDDPGTLVKPLPPNGGNRIGDRSEYPSRDGTTDGIADPTGKCMGKGTADRMPSRTRARAEAPAPAPSSSSSLSYSRGTPGERRSDDDDDDDEKRKPTEATTTPNPGRRRRVPDPPPPDPPWMHDGRRIGDERDDYGDDRRRRFEAWEAARGTDRGPWFGETPAPAPATVCATIARTIAWPRTLTELEAVYRWGCGFLDARFCEEVLDRCQGAQTAGYLRTALRNAAREVGAEPPDPES